MTSNAPELFEQLLGPISPMGKATSRESDGVSVSFQGDLENSNAATGYSAQSRPSRAPFGERANLHNQFEFSRPALKGSLGASDIKPFGLLSSQTPTTIPTPTSTVAAAPTPMSTSEREPATPASVAAHSNAATPLPAATPMAAPVTASATRLTWSDVLLWRDPVSSVLLFALGAGLYAVTTWMLSGGASITLASALAYLLLGHLGVNFVRYFCSARWHAACMWEGSAATDSATEAAVRAVRGAAALHDTYLSSKDPHVTLGVALSLWALAWLGTILSARQLLVAGYIGIFTLPALYNAQHAAINGQLAALYRATLGRIDNMEMPRTTRLLALLVCLALLFIFTTWTQFLVGALVAATYWRITLTVHEVEAIRTAAEPLTHEVTHSVRKVRARLSSVLDDARALCSTAGPTSRTSSRINKPKSHAT